MLLPRTYTPDQAAQILQLSTATVYKLIGRGELVAKRIGKVYRIPASELSFVFSGLDADLYQAEKEDLKNVDKIQATISKTRAGL